MTLAEIRERLGDRNLSEVSRRTGISPAYLSKIRSGEKNNPTLKTISTLIRYFESHA
jgi:transcriptional regulator with XRE-family HTH domain